jgi:hypothetical protein
MPTSNEDNQKDKSNKTYTYIAAGIVILALAGWAIYSYSHQNSNGAQQASTVAGTAGSAQSATSTGQSSVPAAKKLSYGDAINTYPYRFQFSQCHGNPGALSVKKGSIVMLDNRDPIAHTFVADSQTFKIAGYDYALLHTSVITNINITCDGGGAAKLNVEK